jgi:hypothetical protein
MSAVFTARIHDELVDYEITPDGEMVFPGHDMAWDDMLEAMGGAKSEQRELLDEWKKDQLAFVFRDFGLPMGVVFRFCLDIIRHVLPIYRLQYGEGGQEETICAEIQKWIDGGLKWPTSFQDSLVGLIDALITSVDADRENHRYDSSMEIEASIHALFALRTLVYTMTYIHDRPFGRVRRDMRNVSDKALLAVEYRATYEQMLRPDFYGAISTELGDRVQTRIVAERAWQIERFIYAINAFDETGAWPPIDGAKTWV